MPNLRPKRLLPYSLGEDSIAGEVGSRTKFGAVMTLISGHELRNVAMICGRNGVDSLWQKGGKGIGAHIRSDSVDISRQVWNPLLCSKIHE